MTNYTTLVRAAAAAALVALPALNPALAQTQDEKGRLRAAIAESLGALLNGDSARVVVDALSKVQPEGRISKSFDIAVASKAWFGARTIPNPAPDCRVTVTPAREAAQELCLLETGRRDADENGSPAYSVLAYSKNIGLGDVLFARRPAGTAAPAPLGKLTQGQAYEQAKAFMQTVGVPMSEVPQPPQGFLPVRTLAIGMPDEKNPEISTQMPIQMVVSFPRALAVPGGFPWLKDPRTGAALAHVIVPGKAMVAMNDAGVQFASIEGWADAQMYPADPRASKSTSELADEIADDLYAEGVRKFATLSILISLRRAYPNPEDPNPPLCPVCGWLLPAVQVSVAPMAKGLLKQGDIAPPGVVREYDLVKTSEALPTR